MSLRYKSTTDSKLDYNSVPMRLWQKAKKYGIWNPNDIDFSQDVEDFKKLQDVERHNTIRTLSQFIAGEEAVTLDLLPLIMAVAKEGRIEEEMFLTSFLWEEAKHVDGFNRYFKEVLPDVGDVSSYVTPSYTILFEDILPNAMNALITDASPENMARASVTYNMIVEGVLAETGYFGFFTTLEQEDIMPGLRRFVYKLKQDESRHIAYGLYLLARLVSEHGDRVYNVIMDQMNKLLPLAMSVVQESYEGYDRPPFGLELDMFQAFAMGQFQKRMAKLEKARSQTVEQVAEDTLAELV